MVGWLRIRFALFATTALTALPAAGAKPRSGPPRSGSPAPTPAAPGSEAQVGEAKMRAGDCAAALDAFDEALRRVVSPEIHRDRGLCHEKLEHPYPAIDDYRVYLEARPDASDADAIRVRLAALEKQTGIVQPRDSRDDVSMSIGGDSGTESVDAIERAELLDTQADTSSLRRGKGFVLGLGLDVKRFGSSTFGWAEGAAFDLRYSLSSVSTVLVEVDVTHLAGSGTASSLSGPSVSGGYEARIPITRRLDDAFLVAATLGYEHVAQSVTGEAWSIIEPQMHLGYRHVFGPAFGLEGTVEGGPAFAHSTGASGSVGVSTTTALAGAHVAVVLGF